MIEELRAGDLGDEAPDHKMEGNLLRFRDAVVIAPAELALRPQHEWQGGRDEEHIVEVIVEEAEIQIGFQPPAVQRIQSDCEQTQRVSPVAKCLHSSARMITPESAASPSLPMKMSMEGTLGYWPISASPDAFSGEMKRVYPVAESVISRCATLIELFFE